MKRKQSRPVCKDGACAELKVERLGISGLPAAAAGVTAVAAAAAATTAAVAAATTAAATTAVAAASTTTAAAVATATTAAAEAAAAATTTTAAEAAGAGRAGLGFIDGEGTAVDRLAVDAGNRRAPFFIVAHLNEPEPAGATGFAVDHDLGGVNAPEGLEHGPQFVVGGGEREIANINLHRRYLILPEHGNIWILDTACSTRA
jgi:hypothetical protein